LPCAIGRRIPGDGGNLRTGTDAELGSGRYRAFLRRFAFATFRMDAITGREGIFWRAKGPEFPKNSRLVTAVILLGAIALPLLPIGREARNTVAASWRGFRPSARDRAELAAIAAQAEKEKDARELAFVALSYPDPDRAIQFADRATTLDPSLVWIYASRYYGGRIENLSRIAVRLKRVENSDPETPASDNEWMKEMQKAFRAPRYDGYYQRHEEWIREGGRKTQVCPQGWWRSACGPAAFRMRSKCRHMRICGSSKPCKRPRREMWMRQKPC
jgi:hypothetical protein